MSWIQCCICWVCHALVQWLVEWTATEACKVEHRHLTMADLGVMTWLLKVSVILSQVEFRSHCYPRQLLLELFVSEEEELDIVLYYHHDRSLLICSILVFYFNVIIRIEYSFDLIEWSKTTRKQYGKRIYSWRRTILSYVLSFTWLFEKCSRELMVWKWTYSEDNGKW